MFYEDHNGNNFVLVVSQIISVGYNHVIFFFFYYVCFVMLLYFSLFGCRIFFMEGTESILLGVKSMSCIVQFEQESCDVVASRTKSLQ